MSFENPTPVRLGLRGSFAGKDFSVVGRMVMGVEINGETYYWNEFNLQAKTGEAATLVYEEGTWRLFTEFEPDHPLPAAEAVLKQVGDRLNLTGVNVRVTFVSTACVYRIEGMPPAGEKVGDEENYFNAESGDVMQVVSWSGTKVEYYNGITLSPGSVEKAFRLPAFRAQRMAPARIFRDREETSSWSSRWLSSDGEESGVLTWVVVIAIVFGLILWENFSFTTTYEAPPVKRVAASASPLMAGTAGHCEGKNFHITAHAAMEVGEVGKIWERNEYELTDEYGIIDLLVCGEKPGDKDWILYTPLAPLLAPTPQQSVTQKPGDTVNIDGVTATITELAQFTVKSVDNTARTRWHQGDASFGYAASSEYNSLLVRWDKQNISFWRGKKISAKDFSTTSATMSNP